MRCPACGTDYQGGIGARCPRCGFLPAGVSVTPMEYVVHVQTGLHKNPDAPSSGRGEVPPAVPVLYAFGFAVWLLPLSLWIYFRVSAMPGSSWGWRTFGIVLAVLLAVMLHLFSWVAAFFYGRLVTSDHIAQQAERDTHS